MNRFPGASSCLRLLPGLAATLLLFGVSAPAAPLFTAAMNNAKLTARLDWSSDLGVDLVNQTGPFVANGTPVTVSASAFRDGRNISGSITQTAPYVLNGQYWAADWTGGFSIPAGGGYGLSATTFADGNWSFSVSPSTVMYYAAIWTFDAPAAIHPTFNVANIHPTTPLAGGSAVGSFRQQDFFGFGIPGFPSRPTFSAETFSLDTNAAATVTYSYRIAFSTTPIDARVFDPPVGAVPEPSTLMLGALGLAAMALYRRRA